MAIELPSKPDVLDERLASLEDPSLAERLFRENPALFAVEPPRTEREVLAWTTRRFGTAVLAVTAALSLAAGYFGYEVSRGHAASPQTARPSASVTVPVRHAPRPSHPRASTHQSTPVTHHAAMTAPAAVAAPIHHHASAPVAAYHTAPLPARHVASSRVNVPAHHVAPSPAHQTAPQTAAAQLAAWEATHPATHARPRSETATDPASRTEPRTEAAPATQTATSTATTTATTTEPAGATSVPAGVPEQTSGGGVKNPPASPGGVWSERPPIGGVLGDGHGPVIGAPRDPCTPRGGRTGIVMQAISILASGRH